MEDEQIQREIEDAKKSLEFGAIGIEQINFVHSVLIRVNDALKTRLNIPEKPTAKIISLYQVN